MALEFATPVNTDGRHSKSMAFGHYSKAMKGGLYWEVNKLADTDAPFVPRSGNFRLHTTMMDKSFDLIEVSNPGKFLTDIPLTNEYVSFAVWLRNRRFG